MSFDQSKIAKYSLKYPDLDWSESVYNGAAGMMTAVCGKHGPITKTGKHWNVNGCPSCGREKAARRVESRYDGLRATSRAYRDAFKNKWDEFVAGNRYDTSATEFVDSITRVTVRCRDHDEFFEALPKNLVGGGYKGCPKCRVQGPRGADYYRTLLERQWSGKYTYVRVPEYRHDKVVAMCSEHGEFSLWLNNHLSGHGCPVCSNRQSGPETEILEFVKSVYGGEVVSRDKTAIGPLELDVYLPSLAVAIEFNGLHWHSDDSGATPLRSKWELCQKAGIRLVNIFEDEWHEKKSIVKSRILSILGLSPKIYARLCGVSVLDSKTANSFHRDHHIGGPSGGVHYSLTYGGAVVAVLTMKNHGDKWEVMRYSSSGTVVGGFSKLFAAFTRVYNPSRVISYCDLRYGTGGVYEKSGFSLVNVTRPDYFWFKNHVRYNRQRFQKHKLAKSPEFANVYSDAKTEREMAVEMGYRRISGVGHQMWTLEALD